MKPQSKKYIIGTRGSLLALTQAGQVKKTLEEKTPHQFELKIITTQGDQITDKPLWQLEGKDFFTKELDHALLNKDIDLVIHSYKDLGSERPDGITLAAITKRQFAGDILLIKKETVKKLSNWPAEKAFIVGTSAPRRITNIESSLAQFLPAKNIKVSCQTLRGNVNSRIEKLQNDHYDAIILAHAGIERLAITEKSAKILTRLLKALTFKILPLANFPPAASQGALAIETHKDNQELIEIINSTVHHPESAKAISEERKVFQSYGGGCHLALGVHVIPWEDRLIKFQKGNVDHQVINEKSFIKNNHHFSAPKEQLFIGLPKQDMSQSEPILFDELSFKKPLQQKENHQEYENLFITSSYCFEALKALGSEARIWAAGESTHKKLSQKGYWVCGETDSLGIEKIEEFLQSKAIQILLKEQTKLSILSEEKITHPHYPVIASYQRQFHKPSEEFLEKLKTRTAFYWGSYPQFEFYTHLMPQIKTNKEFKHYCGLGKTYHKLKKEPINLIPLISFQELIK